MIKWLTGAQRRSRDWVTDDPLAIVTPKPYQVYAVTRVNPIFVEEDIKKSGHCVCFGAGKSGSSGYESQRSSSGWSGEEDTLEHPPGTPKHAPSSHPKLHTKPSLHTIPEGRIDYCIPRPIWPRYEDRQRKPPAVRFDGNHRGTQWKMRRPERRPQIIPGEGSPPQNIHRSPYDLLRELSLAFDFTVERNKEIPAEEILRDISNKINKSLDALASQDLSSRRIEQEKLATNRTSLERVSSEAALRRLSVNLSRSEAVITVGRALSLSGSSGSDSDLEAGRRSLLRRLGRFPAPEPLYDLSQGSTSSSSSGFSDLTPTPPSSSSYRPFGPVFLHENPTSVPNRVRNAMIYETLQCRTPGGYEKLRVEQKLQLDRQWTECEKEVTNDIADKEICEFPYSHWPDFTLDGQQAELLTRRLQASKRHRCWCRLITTALGFFFFIFSVIVVSMVCTKGKRMFGSV